MPIRRLKAHLVSTALLLAVVAIFLTVKSKPSPDQPLTTSQSVEFSDSSIDAPDSMPASNESLGVLSEDSADCPEATSEAESLDLSQFSALQVAIVQRLADSSDPEHLLVASYVARFQDMAHGWHLLSRALEASPGNTLIVRSIIGFCLQYPDSQSCEGAAIDHRAVSADGQNGTLLLAIAARRAKRGDSRGALEALEKAATAPLFDSYFAKQVLAADRALSAASPLRPSERLTVSFGIVPLPLEEAGFEVCREHIDSSTEWRHMCLRAARRMENEGDTMVVRLLGTALQGTIHRLNGDSAEADAADQRRAALRESWAETAEVLDEQILRHNPQLINRYLGSLTSYGEAGASEFIRNEYIEVALTNRCRQQDRTVGRP